MPKKMGVNSKAEEARLRKAASESEKRDKQAREKEEQYWQAAEGPKSKSAKKREEEEAKRAETAAKKAEARRLAEIEAAEIDKALKSKAADKKAARVAVPVPKVTEAELRRRKEAEAEAEAIAKGAEDAKKKMSRMADEDEYEKIVLVQNLNRDENVIEAHGLDEAIAKIVVNESLPVDKHPEKRLKASFKAFEEAEMPRLKAEKPGLTHTQYKDLIWKSWKKSPDNPLNKAAAE